MARIARLIVALLAVLAVLGPRGAAAASTYDYEWAIPEWRATWALPKLADNRGFAVRATGDAVYVAGLAGSAGQGAGDLVLLAYSLGGTLQWVRSYGGFELDQAQGMAIAESGFFEGVWLAGSITRDDGRQLAALLRYGFDGTLLSTWTWSLGVRDVAQAVCLGIHGPVVGGLTHPTHANRDGFVRHFSADGTVFASAIVDGGGWDEIWDVECVGSLTWAAGYTGTGTTSEALAITMLDAVESVRRTWGGPGNDEARAIVWSGGSVYATGGMQSGRSTDTFVSKMDAVTLAPAWDRTTGGAVVGGGGYGIDVGERGIYVAAGTYDFPAGGDSAIMRFTHDGALEWTQVAGLPGFWDWNFDVDARDGRFYVAGVLWQPGLEWYRITTYAYDEWFPTATVTRLGRWMQDGSQAQAARAIDAFSVGDFLRWASSVEAANPGSSRIEWEGSSDYGREYGHGWVDTSDPALLGDDNVAGAILGLQNDLGGGNYALVRDWTSVHGSLLDGLIRFRYTISHDRLIPQGGYVYVGETGVSLPPPPV